MRACCSTHKCVIMTLLTVKSDRRTNRRVDNFDRYLSKRKIYLRASRICIRLLFYVICYYSFSFYAYLVRLAFNCALSTCHTGNLCVSTLNFNKSSSSRQNWTQQHLFCPAVEPVCRKRRRRHHRRCCCHRCRSTIMTNCFSCSTRRVCVYVCAYSFVLPAVFVAVCTVA